MMTATIIIALKSALGLLFIWIFVFLFWKDYCLDLFREDVFGLRDELFLYAADGKVDFDHPAYTLLRQRMNVSLRYAHEFTLARFALAIAILSKVPNTETATWEESLAILPHDVQKSLIQYRDSFVFAFLKYVTLRSFFLYIIVLLGQAVGGFQQAVKHYCLPKLVMGVERLESEALEEETRNQDGPMVVGAA
jgi:hypothetical protein